ncbi:Hint domain-containing protein [Microcella sp.]|uniref:Hint domain-containing protein n=1 Tax=Microcella sp. TaxID=1913979 RepID=UPI00391C214F
MTDGSTEPIEHIDLGDEVCAADPESGEAGARPVTALIEGEGVKDLVTVSTASGSVVATAEHPFWSVSDAAWVDASRGSANGSAIAG